MFRSLHFLTNLGPVTVYDVLLVGGSTVVLLHKDTDCSWQMQVSYVKTFEKVGVRKSSKVNIRKVTKSGIWVRWAHIRRYRRAHPGVCERGVVLLYCDCFVDTQQTNLWLMEGWGAYAYCLTTSGGDCIQSPCVFACVCTCMWAYAVGLTPSV